MGIERWARSRHSAVAPLHQSHLGRNERPLPRVRRPEGLCRTKHPAVSLRDPGFLIPGTNGPSLRATCRHKLAFAGPRKDPQVNCSMGRCKPSAVKRPPCHSANTTLVRRWAPDGHDTHSQNASGPHLSEQKRCSNTHELILPVLRVIAYLNNFCKKNFVKIILFV